MVIVVADCHTEYLLSLDLFDYKTVEIRLDLSWLAVEKKLAFLSLTGCCSAFSRLGLGLRHKIGLKSLKLCSHEFRHLFLQFLWRWRTISEARPRRARKRRFAHG